MNKFLIGCVGGLAISILSGCGGGGSDNAQSTVEEATAEFQFYNYLTATGSSNAVDVTAGLDAGIFPIVVCPRPYDNNSDRNITGIPVGDAVSWNLKRCDNDADIVANRSQAVAGSKAYTVLAVGDVVTTSGLDVITLEQDKTAAASDKVRMRFIHTLSQLTTLPVDVVVGGVTLVSDLQYQAASAYFSLTADAANGVTISIQQAGTEIGSGVCVSSVGASYEAVLAYADFDTFTPTVYCHAQ